MPHETPPMNPSHEAGDRTASDFEVSAAKVFDLLNLVPESANEEGANSSVYFHVSWNAEAPLVIDDARIMTASPTGARRQEINGLFHSAQFRVTETLRDGTQEPARYLWLGTKPQQPGSPIEPDPTALATRSGYRELSTQTALAVLVEHAKTVEDFGDLLSCMHARGINDATSLAKGIKSLIHRLSFGMSVHSEDGNHRRPVPVDVFGLISKMSLLDTELSRVTQGNLLGNILRTVAWEQLGHHTKKASQDMAAATLETALLDGIIEQRPEVIRRILTTCAIYKYPFATDLLYDYLTDPDFKSNYTMVLSQQRQTFAHDYMLMVLEGQLQTTADHPGGIKDPIRTFLVAHRPVHFTNETVSLAPFIDLARKCMGTSESTGSILSGDRDAQTILHEHGTTAVTEAFGILLATLNVRNPKERTQDELIREHKFIENVRIILTRTVAKKFGEQVIASSDVIEPDNDNS